MQENPDHKPVVTRFAPSPTGYFHAGSYRTALLAWIYARQHAGKFILRIEDTDKERSKREFEENIVESLKWLGLDYDEFYRQSERTEIYRGHIRALIASGHAYVSKEDTTGKPAGARAEVIRFRNPNKKVVFHDMIKGDIETDTTELGDFVIAKSEDEPVFHLVVVIDDIEMGVTHIIRGEDHISNTPRQILIFEALGAAIPQYAHLPLVLSATRAKLSKRHGAVAVSEYRSRGYLPAALVNFMALLGWHPEGDQELFTLQDLIRDFTLERVQKGGAIFDDEKLKWFDRQYILKLDDAAFAAAAASFMPSWLPAGDPRLPALIAVLRDKIAAFGELPALFETELAFVRALPEYGADMLLWKKEPDRAASAKHLAECRALIAALPGHAADDAASFTAESVKAAVWPSADANGRGNVLWPLRMALTGQEKSPDPFASAAILGKEETLARIDAALAKLA